MKILSSKIKQVEALYQELEKEREKTKTKAWMIILLEKMNIVSQVLNILIRNEW